ncbi:maestro heat-like repeat-containing protein family member 7 isoform X1 [Pogoniulus pusillus]|uniref:maestro heat-like repeat-containing protein family member 7 isoform X1 n=1 Tax=Pogoniulus pusillus TaxID=488313 RepID=UPI0030B93F6C
MAERPPGTPRQAWEEKGEATLTPSSVAEPSKVCEVEPLQAAVPRDERALKAIIRFTKCRLEQVGQKLLFLAALCTFCTITTVGSTVWGAFRYFQEEVMTAIQVMLQEEPDDCLDTTVRQQVMLAVAGMSRARLLPHDKDAVVQACIKSVFRLPPRDSQGSEASLYSKTLAALDSMLVTLVHSAGTRGVVELQSILKVLLPYTFSQLAEVQKRAVARIARLLHFITTYSLLEICPCFAQGKIYMHECAESHHFLLLGKLVGQLTLSYACKDEETSCEAAEALYQLHVLVLQQRNKSERQNSEQLQPGSEMQPWIFPREKHAIGLCWMFTRYLQPSDQAEIMVTAIKAMGPTSRYNISVAAQMVDIFAGDSALLPRMVKSIVGVIFENLPFIRAEVALKSVHRALLLLMDKQPRVVVDTLLDYSPINISAARTMWNTVVSKPQTARKALQELVRVLTDLSQRKTSPSRVDNPRLQCLSAIMFASEAGLQPICQEEVHAIFPQLFLALLFQVTFTTELRPDEVLMWWGKQHQHLSPVRAAVQSMRVLLCRMGFRSQVFAIEAQGGWDALLSAPTHLAGVRTVAREMMVMPRFLRSSFFCHLAELLSVEDPTWEMTAMVFFIEILERSDCEDEVDCALGILDVYLRSQCLGMPSLVLRAILRLTERPDTARKTLILLPLVMERLQDDDDATSDAALHVLANMLRLLEGKTLSLTALELAAKLWPLFGCVSDTVRELSIHLFRDVMGLVAGKEKKKMKNEVQNSLLPLLFHLHDESKSVAKASQEALRSAGRFLNWRRLAQLAGTEQAWRIRERLLAKNRSRTKDYLHQSQRYLQNPQVALRLEAVRFIGLIGRQVDRQEDVEHVREVLRQTRTDGSLPVSSLLAQTMLLLNQRSDTEVEFPTAELTAAEGMEKVNTRCPAMTEQPGDGR